MKLSVLFLTIVLMFGTVVIGNLYGRHLRKKSLSVDTVFKNGPRGWIFLSVTLLACFGVFAAVKFPDKIPPVWYAFVEPASWIMVQLMVIFIASMAIPLSFEKNRSYPIAIGLFSLFCVGLVQYMENLIMAPIQLWEIKERHASDGSILQSTQVTCSAAALANALLAFQITSSEKECARILETRASGTTVLQILDGVKKFGLYGYYVPVLPGYLVRMNRPAIISINLRVMTHSVAILGHDEKGNLHGVDPAAGTVVYTPEKLLKKLATQKGVVLCDRPVVSINAFSPEQFIRSVQNILHTEKHLSAINGHYDEPMREAVKGFQQKFKIKPTGDLDPFTFLMITGPYKKEI